ncbi:MAG: hypothetical protein WAW88_15620, partial [Nocardioides sp.]
VIDPTRTAERLAGLAHVVTLGGRPASHALTDALGGSELSVFGGAARLYWPGMHLGGRRTDHPLWLPERLQQGGRNRFAAVLFARLGRLSALTLGPPELEARLRRQAQVDQRAEAAERLAALTRQTNEAMRELDLLRAEPPVLVVPDDDQAEYYFAQWEETNDELERVASERNELQEENEGLQRQLDVALENIKTMAIATASSDHGDAEDEEEHLPDPAPDTVLDAVKQAAALCTQLEILPEAYTSARGSEYPAPQRVLEDLLALDKVARDWSRNALPSGGFEEAFIQANISCFRSGISSTARQQYGKDYERSYKGETIMLGPHLARGVGAVTTILRIYWYLDAETRTFVVGHVGCKLRDESNS